ncbi:MAG: FAD-binding oxidoreductase [Candidatus Kapabacteria bacterium]|nr:FAD-binding oxidoreductase [Candidatus Kapabacteria bacterium]
MSSFEYFNGRVSNITQETKNVNRFYVEFPELEFYDFKSGQYAKIDMPIEDKKTYRQYSISSEPLNNNKIEFLIVHKEKGLGTEYLFNEVKIGTELKISKPLGRFVLPEIIEKDICFICTGVGLAPFRSMYLDIMNKKIPHKNIYVVFGSRFKEDLCLAQELYDLDKNNPEFHYIPVLSREEDWSGAKGYVHNIYKELFSDKRPAMFYLCGWEVMIKEARNSLRDMGYERKDILFEKYD